MRTTRPGSGVGCGCGMARAWPRSGGDRARHSCFRKRWPALVESPPRAPLSRYTQKRSFLRFEHSITGGASAFATMSLESPARPLRADAQRNRDKLLSAAVAAFASDGEDVPLETIAAQA